MTATAKVISIGDAREARRRRVDASQRASLSFKAKTPTKVGAKAESAAPAEAKGTLADLKAMQAERAATRVENAEARAVAKAEKAAAKEAKAHTRTSVNASKRAKKLPKHVAAAIAKASDTAETPETPAVSKASAYAAAFAAPSAGPAHSMAAADASAKERKLSERAEAARAAAREHRAAKRFVLRNKVNNVLSRPFATGVLVFCGLLLIMGIFLYPTARTYYQAVREQARLEQEFLLVLERNEQLAEDIEFLQTDEGIMREAREQLGWVERGERAVIVYGTGSAPEADVNPDIVSSTVKAPVTWYSPFLDFFFGYK